MSNSCCFLKDCQDPPKFVNKWKLISPVYFICELTNKKCSYNKPDCILLREQKLKNYLNFCKYLIYKSY